jgi:hypothetical protein
VAVVEGVAIAFNSLPQPCIAIGDDIGVVGDNYELAAFTGTNLAHDQIVD